MICAHDDSAILQTDPAAGHFALRMPAQSVCSYDSEALSRADRADEENQRVAATRVAIFDSTSIAGRLVALGNLRILERRRVTDAACRSFPDPASADQV